MNLKDFLKFQIENSTNIVTEKSLAEAELKQYYSGRDIRVGDKVLIGIIAETDPVTNLPFTIINFCEDEIDLIYEEDTNFTKERVGIDLPILKRIEKII